MKKLRIILLLGFLFPGLLMAQQQEEVDLLDLDFNPPSQGLFSNTPDFGLQLGSSFSTGFGGGSMFTQSIAPHLSFNTGRNFNLVFGSVISTSNMGSMPALFNQAMPERFLSTTLYAAGAYQVNPRLILTGGSWVERNNMNFMQDQMNPQAFNLNAGGVMMGMEYRLTENLRFGAEINVSRGQNPFNMYNNRNFHSNPFQNRYPW